MLTVNVPHDIFDDSNARTAVTKVTLVSSPSVRFKDQRCGSGISSPSVTKVALVSSPSFSLKV
jgi:hypothetical protein